jgi:carbon storage regulator CsrA
MLVLSRRVGGSFSIGDEVTVTLVSAKSGSAKIGIEAPRSWQIVRDDAKRSDPVKRIDSGVRADKEAMAFRLLEHVFASTLVLQPFSETYDQALVRSEVWSRVKAFFHNELLEQMAREASMTVEGGG